MKAKAKTTVKPVERATALTVAPPATGAGQATCPQPAPTQPVAAGAAPPRQLLPLADMLRIGDWLNAQEAAQVGNESLAQAIARLNSLAQQGSKEAFRALVQSGNYIASSLFILWANGNKTHRELLRKVAAEDSRFPVNYHQEEVHDSGWKQMVVDLDVGSAGPRKPDANQRSESDVVDGVIDGFISTVEGLKKMPANPSLPDEHKEVPELVGENASVLAKRIVRLWEESDPEFRKLALKQGRNFKKRIEKKTKALEQKRNRSNSDPSVTNAWREDDKKKLAAMKQTTADVRADLTEAITSRLKSRLKSSPK
jgi:hypothetical protein